MTNETTTAAELCGCENEPHTCTEDARPALLDQDRIRDIEAENVVRLAAGLPLFRLGRVECRYPSELVVRRDALIVGDWAAHSTGKFLTELDEETGAEVTIAQWAVTHVPSGKTPSAGRDGWGFATRLALALAKRFPVGSDPETHPDRKDLARAAYAEAAEAVA